MQTRTIWRDLDPTWDEWFQVDNVDPGTVVTLSVWDKDTCSTDDLMGSVAWRFDPLSDDSSGYQQSQRAHKASSKRQQLLAALGGATAALGGAAAAVMRAPAGAQPGDAAVVPAAAAAAAAREGAFCPFPQQQVAGQPGVTEVTLRLEHPTRRGAAAGKLHLQVASRPSAAPGAPRMQGPVRCRQNLSLLAGMVLGKWGESQVSWRVGGGAVGRPLRCRRGWGWYESM
ncbi:hypothetical protein MNEG_9765 [Monoraphidium neglectum]|uniref:C2 domain-containing protein n=1 Tax=Monoraphidium neglectum TaxID=145388 RepID=A0A0D2KRM4_9CHLO|nr:hypothetical protein MNEG_9765 [Monoraphidium neglectum]KIY98198.1 hypothetical protein MNEG_9765 [Monoraphidium neglectum]|eukprot:XP_013897218.1 hypothetical protein MNEG_9765 [Monoraphidium neglectum]